MRDVYIYLPLVVYMLPESVVYMTRGVARKCPECQTSGRYIENWKRHFRRAYIRVDGKFVAYGWHCRACGHNENDIKK